MNSCLGQSKEYQELLGTQWLIVNCLLEMTVQEYLCYVVTKFDIYLQSTLCHSCFFLKEQGKQVEKNLAKFIKFWVGHSYQRWDINILIYPTILNRALSPQKYVIVVLIATLVDKSLPQITVIQRNCLNMMKQFLWMIGYFTKIFIK